MKKISKLLLSLMIMFIFTNNVEASEKITTNKEMFTNKEIEKIISETTNIEEIEIETEIITTTDTELICESSIVDVPITNKSSTTYVIGVTLISTGLYLLLKNVKKQKNYN